MQVHQIRSHVNRVVDCVGREMFGLDPVIRLCLAALYSGGHVLLEGNPGLGKTELVKSVARALHLPAGRIQFTPDLMPADITGTFMLSPRGELEFKNGPIFTSLLIADEINRATPKTQSAMLEAMAEKKVTVLGTEHELPFPFFVMATQNPIDHEGTYNLPAAQADRFMFKIRMPVPGARTVGEIVTKRSSNWAAAPGSPAEPHEERAPVPVAEVARAIRNIRPLSTLQAHIANIYLATNRKFDELENTVARAAEIRAFVRRFEYGISPRAAGDVMLAAKAWVCLSNGTLDEASAFHLQAVVVEALRHRLRLSFEDDGDGAPASDAGDDPDTRLDAAIRQLCVMTAPNTNEYVENWRRWQTSLV